MYINIERKYKCSSCDAVNYTEMVTRLKKTYIRCIGCGHEKMIAELSTSDMTGNITYYSLKDQDKPEIF